MQNIIEAKNFLMKSWEKGVECPCCEQFVKLYKRKLNSGMAITLVRIYKNSLTNNNDWLHVKNYLRENRFSNSHDWTLLKYWGLLEEKAVVKGEPNSGYWRITPKGEHFVLNSTEVPEAIYMFNQNLYKYSTDNTNIIESLGKKFNYYELMN